MGMSKEESVRFEGAQCLMESRDQIEWGINLRCAAGMLNWGAGWKAAEMKTD